MKSPFVQVYKRFTSDHHVALDGGDEEDDLNSAGDADLPPNVTTYEMKIHLATRLMENMEVFLIQVRTHFL